MLLCKIAERAITYALPLVYYSIPGATLHLVIVKSWGFYDDFSVDNKAP